MFCGEALEEKPGRRQKRCQACGELIDEDCKVCPYCGESTLDESPAETETAEGIAEKKETFEDLERETRLFWILPVICMAVIIIGVVFLLVKASEPRPYGGKYSKFETFLYEHDLETVGMVGKRGRQGRELTRENRVAYVQYDKRPAVYFIDGEGALARYDLKADETTQMRSITCSGYSDPIYFDYAPTVYSLGESLVISGYNGYNGAGAGDNVVVYDTRTRKASFLCFGRHVRNYLPFMTALKRELVQKGDYAVNDVYANSYRIYSVRTMAEAETISLTGDIGGYEISMSLALDTDTGVVVGYYYYTSQGPDKKIYLEGVEGEDGMIHLDAYLGIYEEAPNTETITMSMTSVYELSGTWRDLRNGKTLDINLSF